MPIVSVMTEWTDESALEAASAAAWRERYVLEVVLLKLETERALAAVEMVGWLAHADRELQLILEQARMEEVLFAAQWHGISDVEDLIEPWITIFDQHHHAVGDLIREVASVAGLQPACPTGGDARRQVQVWAQKRAADLDTIDLEER